ncbi:MAG: PKD domain-containing protein [Phycisphaerales bacterium]|nr:PKD domain-containing protein [Phycisphaerales bacterium]
MQRHCCLVAVVACVCGLSAGADGQVSCQLEEAVNLTASDATAGDDFGRSMSVSGDTAVVGAHLDDDAGSNSGSAYVFVRSEGVWTEQQELTASDAAAFDRFGNSVSVSGNTAVVGAWRDDDAGSDSGSAYVFVRNGSVWTEHQKLTASDAGAVDFFGVSVSVSGNTAVVGAVHDDDAGSNSGSAYVFVRSGGVWTEQQKLTASDGEPRDEFGFSVSVSGDTAVVGARFDDDACPSVLNCSAGSAYVFVRNGEVWTEQQKLTASDAASFDSFGVSVAVSGNTAVVGAVFDADAGSNSGSAYVFVRSGSVWTEQQKLTASDAAAGDLFGISVADSGDTAVVGASKNCLQNPNCGSGSAYVFVRSGSVWTELRKLTAPDGAAGDEFGYSVSVSGDTAVVGAIGDVAGFPSGSAYVFRVADCNTNGIPDECDLANDYSADCNLNDIPDECELANGTILDCNTNEIPDECEPDCNGNSSADDCDIAAGASSDCNKNSNPDECDIADGTSLDVFRRGGDGIPDECQIMSFDSIDSNLRGHRGRGQRKRE